MHCKWVCSAENIAVLSCFLICLLFSGCTQKRWSEALSGEENSAMEQLIISMQELERQCPQSFDADMKMFWKSPIADQAIQGYLQLLAPSSMKFIVSNPLGQPVFAFAGDGKEFQILEPSRYNHIRGKVRSLAIRNKIPLILLQGEWFSYLSGRLPIHHIQIIETTKDSSSNTVWLKLAGATNRATDDHIYLHLDPQRKELLGYLFLDDTGKTIAEIRYAGEKKGNKHCTVQTKTNVSGLPWGSEIKIELERISSFDQFTEQDFSLPVPTGFTTQLWP